MFITIQNLRVWRERESWRQRIKGAGFCLLEFLVQKANNEWNKENRKKIVLKTEVKRIYQIWWWECRLRKRDSGSWESGRQFFDVRVCAGKWRQAVCSCRVGENGEERRAFLISVAAGYRIFPYVPWAMQWKLGLIFQLLFVVGLHFFQYNWAVRDLGFIRVT